MNLSDMCLPRQLEADNSAENIRRLLTARTIKIRPESELDIPVITLGGRLQKALQKARLQRRIRLGYEEIFAKLAAEKKGISLIRRQTSSSSADRISRLLFFSNDGAERFYRNIEQTLLEHAPRLLGCQLDIDGNTLGELITGKSGIIKIIMIEHKDAVSDVLRALIDNGNGQ